MFEKLLAVIRSGGTFDINTLATQLETTPSMIKALLSHLQILGVIQPYQSCGESCNGCYFKDTCGPECGVHARQGETPLYVLLQTTSNQAG